MKIRASSRDAEDEVLNAFQEQNFNSSYDFNLKISVSSFQNILQLASTTSTKTYAMADPPPEANHDQDDEEIDEPTTPRPRSRLPGPIQRAVNAPTPHGRFRVEDAVNMMRAQQRREPLPQSSSSNDNATASNQQPPAASISSRASADTRTIDGAKSEGGTEDSTPTPSSEPHFSQTAINAAQAAHKLIEDQANGIMDLDPANRALIMQIPRIRAVYEAIMDPDSHNLHQKRANLQVLFAAVQKLSGLRIEGLMRTLFAGMDGGGEI